MIKYATSQKKIDDSEEQKVDCCLSLLPKTEVSKLNQHLKSSRGREARPGLRNLTGHMRPWLGESGRWDTFLKGCYVTAALQRAGLQL